jgi:hypothetical protein
MFVTFLEEKVVLLRLAFASAFIIRDDIVETIVCVDVCVCMCM